MIFFDQLWYQKFGVFPGKVEDGKYIKIEYMLLSVYVNLMIRLILGLCRYSVGVRVELFPQIYLESVCELYFID